MLTDDFAPRFRTTVNDLAENPVHLLFNQWWRDAPDDVKQAYVDGFLADPRRVAFVEEAYYAEPLELDELAALPADTLGHAYHRWIVDNSLEAQIATNYRQFHEMLEAGGQLDGMPEEMRYAVLRGFQTHDFQHVVTGYDATGRGEIALQAFCLAQLQFPDFAMWISVVTTRTAFVDPAHTVPLMDAITDGWQLGRTVDDIQCERWEDMLDQPLADVRARYAIEPSPLVAEIRG